MVEAMSSTGRVKETIILDKDSDLGAVTLVKAAGAIQGTTTAGSLVMVYHVKDDLSKGDFVGATASDSGGFYRVDGLEVDITYWVDVDTDDDFSVIEFTDKATPTSAEPEVTLNLQ